MTPLFIGSEPVIAEEGKYKGIYSGSNRYDVKQDSEEMKNAAMGYTVCDLFTDAISSEVRFHSYRFQAPF